MTILKRGQALVEFVIILPIFIFLLLAIIDIGKMISTKNKLESVMSSVIEEYKSQNSIPEIEQNLKKEQKAAIGTDMKQHLMVFVTDQYVQTTLSSSETINVIA